MEFDIFTLVFFLIWVGLLLKAVFGIFGRRRSDFPPDGEEEEKPLPPEEEEKVPEKPPMTEVPRGSSGGEPYDYKALRKRILTSWQQEEDKKEKDLPDEMEKPVYAEPAPAPRPAPVPEKREPLHPTEKPVTVSPSIRADEERVKRLVAYANQPHLHHREEKAPPAAAASPVAVSRLGGMDARRWVVYDAVFGKPRALKPWRPVH